MEHPHVGVLRRLRLGACITSRIGVDHAARIGAQVINEGPRQTGPVSALHLRWRALTWIASEPGRVSVALHGRQSPPPTEGAQFLDGRVRSIERAAEGQLSGWVVLGDEPRL